MQELLMGLVGVAVAYVLWRSVKTVLGHEHYALAGSGFHEVRGAAAADLYDWPRQGKFEFEIADAAQYQPALRRLAEDRGAAAGGELACVATLHPGASGRDTGAPVEVRIDGVRVGFLSDSDATRFHRRLAYEGRGGKVSRCEARMIGSEAGRWGDKLVFALHLDLKPFRH